MSCPAPNSPYEAIFTGGMDPNGSRDSQPILATLCRDKPKCLSEKTTEMSREAAEIQHDNFPSWFPLMLHGGTGETSGF